MTQGEINLYLNNKIDSSSYLSKTEADQRYIVKSSNVNSALIIKDMISCVIDIYAYISMIRFKEN